MRPPIADTSLRWYAIETRSYAFPWSEGVFRDCIGGPQHCWVAVNDAGVVIGHAVCSVAVGEAHLLNICITRDQQGYGYGRQFLRFVLRELQRAGAEVLFLEVRPTNRVATALYDSFGFREIGVRKDYYPAPLGVARTRRCWRFSLKRPIKMPTNSSLLVCAT